MIVGTTSFSHNIELIIGSPMVFSNLAYSFQFNAGSEYPTNLSTSGMTFEQKINHVLKSGYPVFVSQFKTTHYDGGMDEYSHYNTHDSLSANKWLTFLDSKGISYIAASVSDEYLGSAFFGINKIPMFDQTVVFNWSNTSFMTPSGSFIYNKLTNYALTAPWRIESSSSETPLSSSSEQVSSSSSAPLVSLIDDFTDGNTLAFTKEYWYIYTDVKDLGESTVSNPLSGKTSYKVVYDDGTGTNNAATIQDFSLVKAGNENDPYVALGLNTKKNGTTYFLNKCTKGFSYRYKGVAHRFHAQLSTVKDYNYHFKTFPSKTVWTEAVVLPSELEQDTWGDEVKFDLNFIKSFVWEVKKTPTSGSLWVDDFYCLGSDLGITPSSSSTTLTTLSSTSITTSIRNEESFVKWNAIENGRSLSLTLEKESSASFDVFDLQGNLVMASRRIYSNSLISLETLPSGRYIARVRTNEKQMMVRLELH